VKSLFVEAPKKRYEPGTSSRILEKSSAPAIGYGNEVNEDRFTIKERFSTELSPGPGFHLAFSAASKEAVDEWHKQGIAVGGTSKGEPKIWSDFGTGYYAAYLTDPDGWQIEAVYKNL
jgi:hypothetical protein